MAERLRDTILRTCLDRTDGMIIDDDIVNNRLNLDNIWWYPEASRLVTAAMGQMIAGSGFRPEAVVPVPQGANDLGRGIAGLPHIRAACILLDKSSETGAITPRDGEADYRDFRRIAVIEDVPDRLTDVHKVLGLPGMLDREIAVYGVWDRGDPATRRPLPAGVMLRSLVSEPIPALLPEDSPFWEYAV